MVERVHRLAALQHHVVGDVDDVADGADPDGSQTCLHPAGRWPDTHARNQPADEAPAALRGLNCHDRRLLSLHAFTG